MTYAIDGRRKQAQVFDKFKVLPSLTGRGGESGGSRNFEDDMPQGSTVAVFNYGSNSPSDLRKMFGRAADFGFGGKAELYGARLEYGSQSVARGCPVATLSQGGAEQKVAGWIALVNKAQFSAIAQREAGKSRAREMEKGRYRRQIIEIPNPRDANSSLQALAFVLNEAAPDYKDHPVGSEAAIKSSLKGEQLENFTRYVNLIAEQGKQAEAMQNQWFPGLKALPAHW